MNKVFIDGSAGTTGLRIYERLETLGGIELIKLPEEKRKDPKARAEALNSADFAFLCLPDDAAREAVSMIENENTAVIDTSTAHRTAPGWTYGFPELSSEHFKAVKNAKRVAVPGCHASGFIALVYPLVKAGIIPAELCLSAFSLTGYSGGGKKMIADYASEERSVLYDAPRQYATAQKHKHLPEMVHITGIKNAPAFCPIVGDFYSGMEVTVPLFASQINGSADDIRRVYAETYKNGLVSLTDCTDPDGFVSAGAYSGRDDMELGVFGNDERILLVARYDNLGKGASGAALQCLNIMRGSDMTAGLVTGDNK
ncbi:MAG: N-acetyl-gamma-glutamyl-phosphate reductase [Clostridia bacterium]|nr:N-acetyl-gamma-glutamyl-phosphate reductase [Clostridia bacterium]